MGRTPSKDKPLDVRERCAILYGDNAREFRVHIVIAEHVAETVLVRAPGYSAAERTASAFSRLQVTGRAMCALAPALQPERYLAEPIYHCVDCGTEIIIPDPRTAKLPNGASPHSLRMVDGEEVNEPNPDGIRCVGCGARHFMPDPPDEGETSGPGSDTRHREGL